MTKETQLHIASVDAGNGGVNGVMAGKTVYFPSVRAAATGDSLGLSKGWEMQYDWVDWGNHRYIYGDDVTRVTQRGLERHMGANRYGNELHRFLVAVALGKLGVSGGDVDLTVFAPPGLYAGVRKFVVDNFMAFGGAAGIQFKGDKKPRVWRYKRVTVFPEGLAALAALMLDDDGKPAHADQFAGNVAILDLGVFTADAVQVANGSFNPETLQHATWQNGGLEEHLRLPILRDLQAKSDDFMYTTVDSVDMALRSPNKTITSGGASVDLRPLIKAYSERFAGWIANNIIDGTLGGLRGFKTCILVGGGAELVEPYLRQWYGGKIFDRKDNPAAKKLHPAYLNAHGGYKLAMARLAAGGRANGGN